MTRLLYAKLFLTSRILHLFVPNSRYKLTCDETWPNFPGSPRDGVAKIMEKHGFQKDVTYGHTKIFIRTPKTLFALEDERLSKLPGVVVFLQKVSLHNPPDGIERVFNCCYVDTTEITHSTS